MMTSAPGVSAGVRAAVNQSLNVVRSSAGTPRSSQMTVVARGKATSPTRSAFPCGQMPAISASVIC